MRRRIPRWFWGWLPPLVIGLAAGGLPRRMFASPRDALELDWGDPLRILMVFLAFAYIAIKLGIPPVVRGLKHLDVIHQRRQAAEFERRRHLCPKCGYNLTGNVSGVCPECGAGIDPLARGLTPSELSVKY